MERPSTLVIPEPRAHYGRPPSSNPAIGRRDPKPPAILVLSPSFFATPIGPSRWPTPAQSRGPQPVLMDTGTSIMPDSSIIVIKSSTKYPRARVQIPFLSPNAPDGCAQLQSNANVRDRPLVRMRCAGDKARTRIALKTIADWCVSPIGDQGQEWAVLRRFV